LVNVAVVRAHLSIQERRDGASRRWRLTWRRAPSQIRHGTNTRLLVGRHWRLRKYANEEQHRTNGTTNEQYQRPRAVFCQIPLRCCATMLCVVEKFSYSLTQAGLSGQLQFARGFCIDIGDFILANVFLAVRIRSFQFIHDRSPKVLSA
jgi:hypothetical protein